jgi:hypothetical protein
MVPKMRRPNRAPQLLVGATLAALLAGGCAAISGLDGITEEACAPNCDGGNAPIDSTVGGQDVGMPSGDAGMTDSSLGTDTTVPADTSPPPDDSPGRVDVGTTPDGDISDVQLGDGPGADAADAAIPEDAGNDAGHADAGADSGTDAGCGPLDTTTNCTACGDTCTANNATASSCNGATCSYTCKANFLDCNASVAPPDLDGCECPVPEVTTLPACCGQGICPQKHHYNLDLLNSTFYDCVAEGTLNQTVAMDACIAFTGSASKCSAGYYCPTQADGGGDQGDQVCTTVAANCQCWTYDLALAGLVSQPGPNSTTCYCPQPGVSSKWN